MGSLDVVIVGGGIVGSACAYSLSKRGQKVALLDQFDIPNPLGASGDHARIFRYTYGKDLFYTELAVQSLDLWKELQQGFREELYVSTGMLDLALKEEGYEAACYKALKDMRLPVEKLGIDELKKDYRIWNPRAFRYAVFHPDGGMLWAQRAVAAFSGAAARKGAVIRKNTQIVKILRDKSGIKEIRDRSGKSFKADRYLFAAGSWSRELLDFCRLPLKMTRQELLYFRPAHNQGRFRPEHCPVYSCKSRGFYGFPVHIHGFMKIGDRRKGPVGKPGVEPLEIAPGFEKSCRRFLSEFMPDAANFVETEGKVCFYDNTPDDDFLIDRIEAVPNAYIAAGFSGHGFKFGPLVGEIMADLMMKGKTELNIQRFALSRFK